MKKRNNKVVKKVFKGGITGALALTLINAAFASDYYKSPFLLQEVINEYGTFCSDEGSECKFSGTKKVMFVSKNDPSKYKVKTVSNQINCSTSVFGDPDPTTSEKVCYFFDSNLNVSKLKLEKILNEKYYIVSDGINTIIKDFAGNDVAVIKDLKLDYSVPYLITDKNLVIVRTKPENSNYVLLNDSTNNNYSKFIYVTIQDFYTGKKENFKIGIPNDKVISFINIKSNSVIDVYYKDETGEELKIDKTTGVVERTNLTYNNIAKYGLVNLGMLGDKTLYFSTKEKKFYISSETGFNEVSGLDNIDFSKVNIINLTTDYNPNLNKIVNKIEVVYNNKKYVTDINDISKFISGKNNETSRDYVKESYDYNTGELKYDINNIENGYKATFNINLNSIYPTDKCGNFKYIANTGKFTDIIFDRCVYRLSNYSADGDIVDNTMLYFYKDFFNKFKYIANLANNIVVELSKNNFTKVENGKKIIGIRHYKVSGFFYDSFAPNNIAISYLTDGLYFRKISFRNAYTTIWFKTPALKELDGLKLSYDVKFINNARWGGITIGNVYIDVNPSRIGFRGPEVFVRGLEQNKKYHVDIIFTKKSSTPLVYNVAIYIDGKLVNQLDYVSEDLENLFKNQGFGIRSNYYNGAVEYTNFKVSYTDYAKDKKVYELLNLKNYFKYRTKLNSVDQANKYINRLLTAYKIAYLVANGINPYLYKTNNIEFNDYIDTIIENGISYKKELDALNLEKEKLKNQINQIKVEIAKQVPIILDNLIYTFSEKDKLDLDVDFNDLKFVDKSISKIINVFGDREKKLLNKISSYKELSINDSYKIERAKNAIDFILKTANLIDFFDKLKNNNYDIELNVDNNSNIQDVLNSLVSNLDNLSSKVLDNNGLKALLFFNSYADIDRYLIPGVMENFLVEKKNSDGTITKVVDKDYFILYGLSGGIDKWTDNDSYKSLFLINALYDFLTKFTTDDIIKVLENHSKDIIIRNYSYDDETIASRTNPITLSEFIATFNDQNKSRLFKDENEDGKNDYNLEDVLLDLYTKIKDNDSDIEVDLGKDPQKVIGLLSLLKTKRELKDNNITFEDKFKNDEDLKTFHSDSLDENIQNIFDPLKNILTILLTKYSPDKYSLDETKYNLLVNDGKNLLKFNKAIFIDNDGQEVILSSIDDLENLENKSLDELSGLALSESKSYTIDNINWNFFDKYLPLYIDSGNLEEKDLIETLKNYDSTLSDIENKISDLENKNKELLKTTVDNFKWMGMDNIAVPDNINSDFINNLKSDFQNKYFDFINSELNNAIQSKVDTGEINLLQLTNIKNFGSLLNLISDKYEPSALTYKDADSFSEEMTQFNINKDIVKKINIDNINQYEKFELPKTKWFNEAYGDLDIILNLKTQLLKGDEHYSDVVDSINKIEEYKNSKDDEALATYVSYVKDNIDKLYRQPIYNLYNVIKLNQFNNSDFDFVLNNYLNKINDLFEKIEDSDLGIDFTNSIWKTGTVIYNPSKKIDKNEIYDKLIKLVDEKVNEINPYINYNIIKNKLEEIKKEIEDFKSKFDKDLMYDNLNSSYNKIKGELNSIEFDKNSNIDMSDLEKERDDLLLELNGIYTEKISKIQDNISDYLIKSLNSETYTLYSINDVNELDNKVEEILTKIGKLADVSDTPIIINSDNNIKDNIVNNTQKSTSIFDKISKKINLIKDKILDKVKNIKDSININNTNVEEIGPKVDLTKITSNANFNSQGLSDLYNKVIESISSITGEKKDVIEKRVKPDICQINSDISTKGLNVDNVCGFVKDPNELTKIYEKVMEIYKNQKQYMNSSQYEAYFGELLSAYPNTLDKIFDFVNVRLKRNSDIKLIGKSQQLKAIGDFAKANCSYIIYKNSILLGLKCNSEIEKLSNPVDNDDPFNKIVLNFQDSLGNNTYYNLINHYETLQKISDDYSSHYKSVFLKLKGKDGVYYLKSFLIPNGTKKIQIKNSMNVYMDAEMNTPILSGTGVEDTLSSVTSIIDKLNKNGISLNEIESQSKDKLIFNDPKLTTFINNNISYSLDKIDNMLPLLNKSTIQSVYNNLITVVTDKLGLKDLNTKEKLIEANSEKEKIFDILNMINNISYTTYESISKKIKDDLSKIKYFKDAEHYLNNLLKSKISAFEELKQSQLFQEKISEINKLINSLNDHISDTSLTELDKIKEDIRKKILDTFSDEKVIDDLLNRLDAKYNEVKAAVQNNIAFSKSYIDANSEVEGKTEVNNILTNTFKNDFAVQLSNNKIFKDLGVIKETNNQYVLDTEKLDKIDRTVNKYIDSRDGKSIDIKKLMDTDSIKETTDMSSLMKFKYNTNELKDKLLGFTYLVLRNGKYTIPVDIKNVSTTTGDFFTGGVTPNTQESSLKNIQYETIYSEVKDSTGKVIGSATAEGDVSIFMPKDEIQLSLDKGKYLTIVRNLSDKNITLDFFQVVNGKKEPIYINDFKVSDVAKYNKNLDTYIYGLKTQELNVTR